VSRDAWGGERIRGKKIDSNLLRAFLGKNREDYNGKVQKNSGVMKRRAFVHGLNIKL